MGAREIFGDKMITPPIPPNCEYFGTNPEPWFDVTILNASVRDENGDSCDGPFLSDPGPWRPIIAAVARCAWLDEMKRISIECWSDADLLKAHLNADAWAEWEKEKS